MLQKLKLEQKSLSGPREKEKSLKRWARGRGHIAEESVGHGGVIVSLPQRADVHDELEWVMGESFKGFKQGAYMIQMGILKSTKAAAWPGTVAGRAVVSQWQCPGKAWT